MRCLVDQDLFELIRLQSLVEGRNAGGADNVSISEDFVFCLPLEVFVGLVIFFIQLALLFPQAHKFLHSFKLAVLKMLDLLVKRNVVDVRTYRLAGPGADTHHFHPSPCDSLCQLIDGDVRWRADQHFS